MAPLIAKWRGFEVHASSLSHETFDIFGQSTGASSLEELRQYEAFTKSATIPLNVSRDKTLSSLFKLVKKGRSGDQSVRSSMDRAPDYGSGG